MFESTTVSVGLDVQARSVRRAALRADELPEERTLLYDEEAVERVLRRWPAVRCCAVTRRARPVSVSIGISAIARLIVWSSLLGWRRSSRVTA